MQVDWLTVIAQIVNFLILIWLLKRFLYRPVIDAMDRREQRIADQIRNAEQREQVADDTAKNYQCKIEALDRDRNALMENARKVTEVERLSLLEEARGEVSKKRKHWQRQVAVEKQEFLRGLTLQAARSIQAIGRRALADLANTELEQQIIQSFIMRLKSLDRETRHAMSTSAQTVRITTSFELDSSVRARLTRAVHEYIRDATEVDYFESPDLLCGIELTVSGRRLSWTLADYLQELEQRLQNQLGAVGDDIE